MYIPNENSTQHGLRTPYGSRTPHKFPSLSSVANIMSKLASQLYPTGRAFYMPKGGIADKTHIAFNRGLIRIVDDANSTIDSCFPDNANFILSSLDNKPFLMVVAKNPTESNPITLLVKATKLTSGVVAFVSIRPAFSSVCVAFFK